MPVQLLHLTADGTHMVATEVWPSMRQIVVDEERWLLGSRQKELDGSLMAAAGSSWVQARTLGSRVT